MSGLGTAAKARLTRRAAAIIGKRLAGDGARLGRGGRPLRIGYARIFHEANAFSPLLTTREDFERLHHLTGAELARAASLESPEVLDVLPYAELTGFQLAADMAGEVEAVPLSSSLAVSGGPPTRECFEWLLEELLTQIRTAGPLDGVYLALHGSMEVHGLEAAPEGVILARVRELLGPSAGLAVSYDLHGNLTQELLEPANILIAYRTNPHWDLAPAGFRAGNRLIRALRGQCRPVHAWRKLPIILGGGHTIDFLPPMRQVFRAMQRLERDPRVLSASLFMVHPYTSADNLGWAVHVCTDGDEALAHRLADELADRAWSVRAKELPPLLGPEAAIVATRETRARRLGPVTWVDVDDIVGAGAPGGNTRLVAALAAHPTPPRAYVPVHDPALAAALWAEPVGSPASVVLRGTPGYEQPEVPLEVIVGQRVEGEFGKLVRLDVVRQGQTVFHVAVSERSPMPIHPRFWRQLGLEPRDAEVLVQKNFFHYRIFYAHLSFRHLPVVSAGATSFQRVRARRYATALYPQQPLTDWREGDRVLRPLPGKRGLPVPLLEDH